MMFVFRGLPKYDPRFVRLMTCSYGIDAIDAALKDAEVWYRYRYLFLMTKPNREWAEHDHF